MKANEKAIISNNVLSLILKIFFLKREIYKAVIIMTLMFKNTPNQPVSKIALPSP